MATCGGFFTYNVIMTCYGFPFDIYWELLSKPVFTPTVNGSIDYTFNSPPKFLTSAGYQEGAPNLNTDNYYQMTCSAAKANGNLQANTNFPYWLSTLNDKVDLRVTLVECCGAGGNNFCSQFPGKWPDPSSLLQQVSPISGQFVMFTTEALYYAQSGYFVTIVMVQWSNIFSCKSRKVLLLLLR